MPDMEQAIKGLKEISEYARVKADIAGIGKGKEVFDSWYRAAEDAIAFLREQEAVRCKDCKHYEANTGHCAKGITHGYADTWTCSDAERR